MLFLSYLKMKKSVVAFRRRCLPVSLGGGAVRVRVRVRVCVWRGGRGRRTGVVMVEGRGGAVRQNSWSGTELFSKWFQSPIGIITTPWPRTSTIPTTLQTKPLPKQTKPHLPKPRLPFQLSLCFLFANVFLLCFVFDGVSLLFSICFSLVALLVFVFVLDFCSRNCDLNPNSGWSAESTKWTLKVDALGREGGKG